MRYKETLCGTTLGGARLAMGLLLAGAAISSAPAVSPDLGQVARRKVERIENSQLKSGETVILSEDEINSLLEYEYAERIPSGVRDPRVWVLHEQAVIHAFIDIGKLQSSSAGSVGLWGLLFGGERELKAVCRPVSSNGRAKVEIESIEISGSEISGAALAWLLSVTVASDDTGPANHLALPENVRELRLETGRAIVVAN